MNIDTYWQRFEPHIVMPEIDFEGQKKIKNSKVLVVGAGGLGCPVSLYLTASGVGEITLIDDDEVSISNLQRQVLYNHEDLEQKKVLVAQRKLKALGLGQTVNSYVGNLTEDNAEELISEKDFVVDCTDNFKARYLINRVCKQEQVPWIYAAIAGFDVQMKLFSHKDAAACFNCLYPEEKRVINESSCEGMGIFSPVAGIAGCLQAAQTLKFLLGFSCDKMLFLNVMKQDLKKIQCLRNDECEVCNG